MVDHRLTFIPHVLEIKKNFATKLDLLKRSRFLRTKFLLGFYFKVILPSVQYGLLLWGACSYSDLCCSIERLHCRAARIIFNLPKDIASWDVLERDHWPTLTYLPLKMDIFKLFYKPHNETLPQLLSKNMYSKLSNGSPLPIEVQSCLFQWSSLILHEFWSSVLPKLEAFYNEHILVELAYPRVRYGLPNFCMGGLWLAQTIHVLGIALNCLKPFFLSPCL